MRQHLLRWQWELYPDNHKKRATLVVHLITAPLFVLGTLMLASSPVTGWELAVAGVAFMFGTVTAQGWSHKQEESRPVPFDGPGDFVLRFFAEQFVTFPRFVMSVLALVALLPILRLLWKPYDEALVAPASGIVVMIVLTLASAKFQSWYLMSALPFFGLSCPAPWRKWWVWVIFASVAQELPLALPRDAKLFVPTVAFATGLSAILFLWAFRSRYFGWVR